MAILLIRIVPARRSEDFSGRVLFNVRGGNCLLRSGGYPDNPGVPQCRRENKPAVLNPCGLLRGTIALGGRNAFLL